MLLDHLYYRDLADQKIEIKQEDLVGKENVDLRNITNSTIIIPFPVKVVFMKNIKGCTLKMSAV